MHRIHRRHFLTTTAGVFAVSTLRPALGDSPPVVNPRATDGDSRHEPDWDERLTVSVGTERGDLVGQDDKVVQAALNYVARLGGGTVQVSPGVFTFRNAVHLPKNVRLRGSGAETVFTKIASEKVALAEDSDWYDREITLKDAAGFRVGDGILLTATNADNGSREVLKRTLVARSGNRFQIDRGLRHNLWLSGKPHCASLFPLLTGLGTADVVIENLALDGNLANNENLNGNYGGCIFFQDSRRLTFRDVVASHYNGDGISFQICHDVTVDNCHCHDNADLGVHPGSGSQRPVLRGNQIERNSIGLFWCWGVKFGLAEHNRISGNRRFGISIGHNDTDNVMRHNEISDSGEVGILFRNDERGRDFWANRNVVKNNRIVDSGGPDGVAIDVQGKTHDVNLEENELRETRRPMNRTGIRIATDAVRIEMVKNQIEGFAVAVQDGRSEV